MSLIAGDREVFWMVWSPEGHPPVAKHFSEDSAIREAERLARTNTGKHFYVLQATHMRAVDAMQRVRLSEVETPF